MAYDYDTDILAGLWTGGEDAEEPYASIIAANPDLFDEDSENRILSTIEAIRSHIELLADRDEARLLHFCLSTMLEGIGSGGFVYGANDAGQENAVVEGNVPFPTFSAGDVDIAELDGVTTGAGVAGLSPLAFGGGDLDAFIAAFNAAGPAEYIASRTQDARLRITQEPTGGATRAAGFVILEGLWVAEAGIRLNDNPTQAGAAGGIFIPKVTEVANNCRDRALQVFEGQIRETALT